MALSGSFGWPGSQRRNETSEFLVAGLHVIDGVPPLNVLSRDIPGADGTLTGAEVKHSDF